MTKIGKFEIIEKVGQGAVGVVYKARDSAIGRIVALKTITKDLSQDPRLLERFYFEARAAGTLKHPNIVTIYEIGFEGGVSGAFCLPKGCERSAAALAMIAEITTGRDVVQT